MVNTLLKCKVASVLSPYVQVRKSKLEKRNKHVEADQKQQVVDCGTKRACKTDTIVGLQSVCLSYSWYVRIQLKMNFGKYKEMCVILHCICYVLSEFNKCFWFISFLVFLSLPNCSTFLLAFRWHACLFRKSVSTFSRNVLLMLVPLNQWTSQFFFCWFLANITRIPVNINPGV